jgi:protein phosphatase PTC7
MNLRALNKIWSMKITLFGLIALIMFGCNALAPVNKTDGNIDSEVIGRLNSGFIVIPHPDKVEKGGEDAVLVKDRLIAVADGVGGWSDIGVDAGKYSKQLIKLVGEIYDKNPNATPKEILLKASNRTTERGSSTLIIGIFDPKNKKLATTMLGDSGYMIIRPYDNKEYNIIYR